MQPFHIKKVDKNFYIRKKESALWREDKTDSSTGNMYFNDEDYKDVDYHKEYPTIHHLIVALMEQDKAFDIRLENIAIDWLVAHRGHFLLFLTIFFIIYIFKFPLLIRPPLYHKHQSMISLPCSFSIHSFEKEQNKKAPPGFVKMTI